MAHSMLKELVVKLRFYCLALMVITAALTGTPARAVLIDWSTWDGSNTGVNGWTGTSWATGYTYDFGGGASVTVTAVAVGAESSTIGISTAELGDNTAPYLRLSVNFASTNNSTSYVDVTFTFNTLASDVGYTIYDIDHSGAFFDDEPSIITSTDRVIAQAAVAGTGDVVDPSKVGQSTSPGTITFEAISDSAIDSDETDGNASVNYGSNTLNSFSIRYTSGPITSGSNPSSQVIGISNIEGNLSAVPEGNTVWSVVAICGVAVFLVRRRRIQAEAYPDPRAG